MSKMFQPTIVILGNPVDGFTYYGPFDSPDEATTWGDQNGDGDWWVSKIENVAAEEVNG